MGFMWNAGILYLWKQTNNGITMYRISMDNIIYFRHSFAGAMFFLFEWTSIDAFNTIVQVVVGILTAVYLAVSIYYRIKRKGRS